MFPPWRQSRQSSAPGDPAPDNPVTNHNTLPPASANTIAYEMQPKSHHQQHQLLHQQDTYVPGDVMDLEVPYRPVAAGCGVRVPYTPRPLLTPADTQQRRAASSTLQHRPSFTEKLVGDVLREKGLGDYVSPTVVRAAEIEIAETFNLPKTQLESAAAALVAQQSSATATPPTTVRGERAHDHYRHFVSLSPHSTTRLPHTRSITH